MGIGKAVKRPAGPTTDKGPALIPTAGPLSPELRAALAVLQLGSVPGGVAELRNLVGERHPNPERSWRWEHVAAYQQLFPLVVTAGRAKAKEKQAASRQVARRG